MKTKKRRRMFDERPAASAAGLARYLSAQLAKKFPRSKSERGKCVSAGFSISRVGLCSEISVDWRDPRDQWWTAERSAQRKAKRAELIAYLNALGYPFDSRGWLETEPLFEERERGKKGNE